MYSGGKDCAVIRWDVETGKKDIFPGGRNRFECGGHFEKALKRMLLAAFEVMSLCLLEQRNLLVSAGVDRVVRLWDPRAAGNSSPGAEASRPTSLVARDMAQTLSETLRCSARWKITPRSSAVLKR